jgi:hypothetical protein
VDLCGTLKIKAIEFVNDISNRSIFLNFMRYDVDKTSSGEIKRNGDYIWEASLIFLWNRERMAQGRSWWRCLKPHHFALSQRRPQTGLRSFRIQLLKLGYELGWV